MANKKLSAVISIGGAVASSLKSAFGSVTRSTSQLGDAVGKLENRQRLLGNAIQKLGRAGADVDKLRAKYAAVTKELDKQRAAMERIQKLEAKREGYRAKVGEAGGKAAGSAAMLGVAAIPVIGAVKQSSDFNYEMQAIGNTADMTREQITALGQGIINTSRDVGQSIGATRDALGYLVAAGLDVPTAEAMLQSIGKTATGTASEIEDVSKAAFTLNDTLKIAPGQMADALGMLVQAGKEGNFEFKDMAKELPVLGAGFVALKMQGREAAATMGAALQIARKGAGSSGEAANNMSNFVNKVMSPDVLKKAQKNFGVDLYKIISDAQKNGGNPMEAAIEAVNKMTKGGDQKLLGELFGDMQVQNFVRPMLQNLDEYKRIKAEVLKAGEETLNRDFASMSETTKMNIEKAGGEIERLSYAFGDVLEPAVGKAGKAFNAFLVPVTKWVQENPTIVTAVTAVVGGVLALRTAFFGAQVVGFLLMGRIVSLGAVLAKLPVVFSAVGTALTIAGKAALFLGRALLLNPIGLAVTVIAGGAYLIWKNWETLGPKFAALWDGIKETFKTVYEWIVGKVGWLLDAPGKIKNAVSNMFGTDESAPELTQAEIDAASKPAMMPLPKPRSANRGTTVNDNSSTVFNITQQPGQDSKALAEEVMRRQREYDAMRMRGRMSDGLGAQ